MLRPVGDHRVFQRSRRTYSTWWKVPRFPHTWINTRKNGPSFVSKKRPSLTPKLSLEEKTALLSNCFRFERGVAVDCFKEMLPLLKKSCISSGCCILQTSSQKGLFQEEATFFPQKQYCIFKTSGASLRLWEKVVSFMHNIVVSKRVANLQTHCFLKRKLHFFDRLLQDFQTDPVFSPNTAFTRNLAIETDAATYFVRILVLEQHAVLLKEYILKLFERSTILEMKHVSLRESKLLQKNAEMFHPVNDQFAFQPMGLRFSQCKSINTYYKCFITIWLC